MQEMHRRPVRAVAVEQQQQQLQQPQSRVPEDLIANLISRLWAATMVVKALYDICLRNLDTERVIAV